LFQDVYAWAGKLRTVRIAKGGNTFCYPENIDREMRRLFAALADRKYFQGLGADDFAAEAARRWPTSMLFILSARETGVRNSHS